MDFEELMRQRSLQTGRLWKAQVVLGLLLVALGTAIFSFPQILIYIVSGLLVMLGFLLVSLGMRMRRMSGGGFSATEIFTRR